MAEVFGIAASAAGFVSLGLEILKGITSYVNAVQGSADELDAITRQVREFNSSIEVIRAVSSLPAAITQLARDRVRAALASGKQDLDNLRQLLEKLMTDPVQSPGIKGKLKQTQKKMAYPFRRESLDRLQQQLQRTNSSLSLTIQALQVEMTASMAGTLSSLEPTILNAVEEGCRTLLDRLDKTINGNNRVTSTIGALTTESRANTSEILHTSHDISDKINGVIEKNELVYNAILNMAREQQTIKCLVAKPAELRDACDREVNAADAEHEFTMEDRKTPNDSNFGERTTLGQAETVAQLGYVSGCICRQYQRTLRSQAQFAGFSFATIESVSRKHLRECTYARYETEDRSRSIILSYKGLRRLLSRAVDISISLTTGAGGCSLSPNITLKLMVDELQSPTFRIMNLLHICLQSSFNRGPADRPGMVKVFETGIQRMLEQYLSKKRSPYEVDCSGQSALHKWIDIISLYRGSELPIAKSLLTIWTKNLLDSGLSSTHRDVDGVVPGTRLLKGQLGIVNDWTEIVSLLCEQLPDPLTYKKSNGPKHSRTTLCGGTLQALRTSTQIASVLGCGSLSAAVLAQDARLVERIITQHPSSLTETNILGQTPFHFSADLPQILALLMHAGGSPDMDKADEEGEYALDYALRLSPGICSSSDTWEACSNCTCVESANILLTQGWRCKPGFLQYFDGRLESDGNGGYFAGQVSYAAKLLVLNKMAYAGATLKNLGLRFLSTAEIDLYHLRADRVLDYYAPKVAQLLSENGVSIPAHIRTMMLEPVQYATGKVSASSPFSQDRTSWSRMSGYLRYSSVYHVTYAFGHQPTNRLPQLLYGLGFQDINHIDNCGYSPLATYLCGLQTRPSHILWLVEHGAKLEQRLPVVRRCGTQYAEPEFATATAAHLTLNCMTVIKDIEGCADDWVKLQDQEVDAYRKLVNLVAPLELFDDCSCGCIENGCHVFKLLFGNVWNSATDCQFSWISRLQQTYAPPPSVLVTVFATQACKLLQNFPLDISTWTKMSKAGLRYFTFEMLGLRHTCCYLYPSDKLPLEEVEEIRDEEREQLADLKQLMVLFEAQYDEFQNTEEEGDKFTNFLATHWAPKMEQVLADSELREMSARELRASEEAGVVWAKSSDRVVEKSDHYLEYWVRKLDKIAPSQNMPGLIEGGTGMFSKSCTP